MGLVVDASAWTEAIATGKAGEIAEQAWNIDVGLGIPRDKPIVVVTDNRANAQVGSGLGSNRARHCLRRYVTFLQRVQSGYVELKHVPDTENPADFLTKFVPVAKVKSSLKYATGEDWSG